LGESAPKIDKRIKDIDAKIKQLEERLSSGQISSEDYIPELLALFYEIEELSPKARAAKKRKINFKATILGGIIGWLVFFTTLVLLGPLEFSLRANSISTTGLGPYNASLNLISYTDIQSIQSNMPLFVFLYYLMVSICTFPDILTIVFPVLGGFVAGIVTQLVCGRRSGQHEVVAQRRYFYVRLDEGFLAGGVLAAILTLIIFVVSALVYGQWLTSQGFALDQSRLPWGYLFRVFLPTLFVYHIAAGGVAGALGEVVVSHRKSA
jgi:hypothetical protein